VDLTPKSMEIILNGQTHFCESGDNVAALVSKLEIDPRSIAIELNQEIVAKSNWPITFLKSGDKLEIVQFVGGG